MYRRTLDGLDDSVRDVLASLRRHLEMNVVFISEIGNESRYMRFVDSAGAVHRIRLRDGEELVPEARLTVPIRLPDGRLYGTMCCSRELANPKADEQNLRTMRVFADLLGQQLARTWPGASAAEQERGWLMEALARKEPSVAYQSIVDLKNHETLGFECLARFDCEPGRPTKDWFVAAESVGLLQDLELSAMRNGLQRFEDLPEGKFLSLNCSPTLLQSGKLDQILAGLPLDRILIEVTEQEFVRDFKALGEKLEPYRRKGLRLAMDDAGSGYSSLQHLMDLRPEVIKLDASFAQSLGRGPSSAYTITDAMVAAMVGFANRVGSIVVAEGVEDRQSAREFQELGVHAAQGFFFSKPGSMETALNAADRSRAMQW